MLSSDTPKESPVADHMIRRIPFHFLLLLAVVILIGLYHVNPTHSLQNYYLSGISIAKASISAEYPIHPGFPINVDYWVEKPFNAIADINNDGNNELVFATWNSGTPYPGRIYAFTASGALLPGFPIITVGHVRSRIALGDLDKNGDLEIVAGVEAFNKGIGPSIYVWRSNGTAYPGWPLSTACLRADQYCGVQSIILADLDNDSGLEVIVGTDNRDINDPNPALYTPNLYAWRSNGQLAAGIWPVEDNANVAIIGTIAVGDLDNDGKADIVTGRDYNRLFAYDNQGYSLPGWPIYTFWPYDSNNFEDDRIYFYHSGVTLADLNQDGILEYIVAGLRSHANTAITYNVDLLVYGPNGQRWHDWALPASGSGVLSLTTLNRMLQAPAIGDLNGDGRPDIVVSTQDGWVRAYTAEKQLLWAYNFAQGKIVYATETVIGDVDGDGWNEVLFGTFDLDYGNTGPFGVWILDHNGIAQTSADPLVVNDDLGVTGAPSLADLDGDGNIEIAAVTVTGKVYVWDAPGQVLLGRLPWPMARHDLQRTGLYVDPILIDGLKTFLPMITH